MQPESFATLGDLVFHLREHWGGRRDLLRAGPRSLSSKELIADAHALALSLEALGAETGQRLALYSHNRPGWLVTDLASHLLGLVTVPIDPRLPPDQIAFVLRNSGAGWLVYGSREERALLDRILGGLQPQPTLVAMELDAAYPDGLALTPMVGQGAERLLQSSLDSLRNRVGPEDPASLSYTSGATGDPRGVLLSHANLTSAVASLSRRLHPGAGARALTLLPWAHPLERVALYSYLLGGASIVSPPPGLDPAKVLERERPEIFVSPPRLLEQLREAVLEEMDRARRPRRRLFHWALARTTSTADRPRPRSLVARRFLGPIRRCLGGRVRTVVSGFAPIAPETESFFLAAGLDLCLGYGLVETAGFVTATRPAHRTIGTVGHPLPGSRIRTERNGEIRVSGPSVMLGYWRTEAPSPLATDDDGTVWLATGDLGRIDRAGRLTVRTRRSSRIALASGELVSPHPLEQLLQTSPWIERAIVVGQSQPHLGALIVPRVPPSAGDRPVEESILGEIQRLNGDRPENLKIRRFHLLPRPISVASGELTRNGQLRRRAVAERWGEEIAAMFAD